MGDRLGILGVLDLFSFLYIKLTLVFLKTIFSRGYIGNTCLSFVFGGKQLEFSKSDFYLLGRK
jgi:hypothetical protein